MSRFPGLPSFDLLDRARSLTEAALCFLMSGQPDVRAAVDAMRRGAVEYMDKPIDIAAPTIRIERALQTATMRRRLRGARLACMLQQAEVPAPNILSAAHIARIGAGILYAATSPWATLLARTFHSDAQACARCQARLAVRAVVTDPGVARQILFAMPAAARAPPDLNGLDRVIVLEGAFA